MRSRCFVTMFIILQGLLLLNVIISLLTARSATGLVGQFGFFLGHGHPGARGISPWRVKLGRQRNPRQHAGTDFLTRLSAWRIIPANGTGIFVQGLLLRVRRAAVSRAALFLSAAWMWRMTSGFSGCCCWGSGLLAAGCIALSPPYQGMVRGVLILGLIFGGAVWFVSTFHRSLPRRQFVRRSTDVLRLARGGAARLVLIFLALMLEAGAQKLRRQRKIIPRVSASWL